ncbi:hypothetical protein [Duganella sp. FT27W]|uniref:hypothetical protein n=1 Tax=Duganella sp. FT27W TaxID=2654636 RepID=UPI00128DB11E|nr:hypothetical protein [Duganella sp. FT27W]MPQ60158.1 hypothetical protein [Duganella sp. FT27W]
MAKIIDYPRTSLRSALQLADAVDGFAGSCSAELAAEKLGKKISGAFAAQIGSAVKFGLIENKKSKLSVTPMYRNYKLAYTPAEEASVLREAFLLPPLFSSIYNRFKGQKLPIEHFEKMLMKEFHVPDDISSRVASYFLDGAKLSGLLGTDNTWLEGKDDVQSAEFEETNVIEVDDDVSPPINRNNGPTRDFHSNQTDSSGKSAAYQLEIRGPGINFSITIGEEDDLEIVQIMLKKISKALKLEGI